MCWLWSVTIIWTTASMHTDISQTVHRSLLNFSITCMSEVSPSILGASCTFYFLNQGKYDRSSPFLTFECSVTIQQGVSVYVECTEIPLHCMMWVSWNWVLFCVCVCVCVCVRVYFGGKKRDCDCEWCCWGALLNNTVCERTVGRVRWVFVRRENCCKKQCCDMAHLHLVWCPHLNNKTGGGGGGGMLTDADEGWLKIWDFLSVLIQNQNQDLLKIYNSSKPTHSESLHMTDLGVLW